MCAATLRSMSPEMNASGSGYVRASTETAIRASVGSATDEYLAEL